MDILKILPHRPPFLFVDEVIAIDEQTIKTRKQVEASDDFFKGHYPGFPLMPGVLVCEAVAQAGAILIGTLEHTELSGKVPVLTRLDNAKFKQMVRPGDTLEIDVRLKEKLANVYFCDGLARVNGKVAVSLDFACAIVDKQPL